jgi:hypothetical protein
MKLRRYVDVDRGRQQAEPSYLGVDLEDVALTNCNSRQLASGPLLRYAVAIANHLQTLPQLELA